MYRQIDSKIWIDQKIKKLKPVEKLLFVYLITNNHTHPAGIYYLPLEYASHELGLPLAEVRKGIDTLSIGYLVKYDTVSEVVWVVNMFRYQSSSVKILKAVGAQLESLGDCKLIREFIEHYDTISIPYTIPYRYAILQNQEQKQDQEQEQKQDQEKPLSSAEPTRPEDDCPHQAIIALYHKTLPELPGIKIWGDTRKKHLSARWHSGYASSDGTPSNSVEFWEKLFNYIRECPHLMGQNQRGWTASLDWITQAGNFTKIVEGNYEKRR